MPALKGEVASLKTVVQRMEEVMGAYGAEEEKQASGEVAKAATPAAPAKPAPPPTVTVADIDAKVQAAITKAMAPKDGELAKLRTELTKAQADLVATKTELAKAQRAVRPSNVSHVEPTTVAKATRPSAMSYVTDLNDEYAREAEETAS